MTRHRRPGDAWRHRGWRELTMATGTGCAREAVIATAGLRQSHQPRCPRMIAALRAIRNGRLVEVLWHRTGPPGFRRIKLDLPVVMGACACGEGGYRRWWTHTIARSPGISTLCPQQPDPYRASAGKRTRAGSHSATPRAPGSRLRPALRCAWIDIPPDTHRLHLSSRAQPSAPCLQTFA